MQCRPLREYLDSNKFQVKAPHPCNNCLKQFEDKVKEENVRYDKAEKVFYVKYPFVENPSILTCNISQAIRIAERVEKRVIKEGLLAEVNADFDKMINYGALAELPDEDMITWNGPAHWVSLQPVLRPEMETTPI